MCNCSGPRPRQKIPPPATRDDLEGLAKSIREVDRKRVQDKDLILKEMKALLRSGSSGGKTTKTSPNSKKSFEHTVQKDETISAIIAAYNADLKSQGAKNESRSSRFSTQTRS